MQLAHDDEVVRADVSYAILLTTRRGCEIRIETTLRIEDRGVETVVEPEELRGADAAALSIFIGPLATLGSNDLGQLELIYRGGLALRVAPHPDFEAWTVTNEDGSLMVASPGGGLVTFPPRANGASGT